MRTSPVSRAHHSPRSTTLGALVLCVVLAGLVGHVAWAGGASVGSSSGIADTLRHVGSARRALPTASFPTA